MANAVMRSRFRYTLAKALADEPSSSDLNCSKLAMWTVEIPHGFFRLGEVVKPVPYHVPFMHPS